MKKILLIVTILLSLAITISAEIVRLEDDHQYIKIDELFRKRGYLAHSGACDKCKHEKEYDINEMKRFIESQIKKSK